MKEQKEQQPVQLIVQNCPTEEDEIDLRELWKTIKKNRKVVYATTALFLVFALLYILIKTPLYEAKALLEIGYIGNKPIESAEVVAQKIKTVFFVDDPKLRAKMDKEAFVQDASPVKKVKKLIKITTYGTSNEKAIKKAQKVIEFVQKDEALKIAQFKKETQAQIDKITRDIEKLKLIDVKKLEDKIALLKAQDLKKIEDQKDLYEKEIIPNIDTKISIAKQQIKSFQNNIENLQKSIDNTEDKAFIALTLVQISNYQNMLYTRQLKINDLKLQKEKILKETIPNLERQKERILKETIPNLERQKEQILKIQIPKLKDQIEALRYKLTPAYISTTKPVGDIQTYDKPAKPKKVLILIVALVTGIILGIFLVFFLEFLRNEEIKEQQ